jgi:GNAT superfamily N-acetyltransferase
VSNEAAAIRELGQPGDLGWVVMAHGEQYAAEFGWDTTFEALVARIVADYATGHRPRREAAWIAEQRGHRVGCVFCVASPDPATAQLRILLVDPAARGAGLGDRLVCTCLDFARQAGYARIVLLTYDQLAAARRIYQKAGFTLASEHPEDAFGQHMMCQTWSRPL